MLLIERETKILSIIMQQGVATVHELAEVCNVTEVTIRRDLRRLESLKLLERTRGGAISPQSRSQMSGPVIASRMSDNGSRVETHADALILAPVQNRMAYTLSERAVRDQIPLVAESAPQAGATYLGPDNYNAAVELGEWTGQYVLQNLGHAFILDITQNALDNTRQRSAGFIEGVRSILGEDVRIISVDGYGLFNQAHQIATDALRLNPEINVIFGVNDDSVLAGIAAYQDLGHSLDNLLAVNVGGEGKTLLDNLQHDGPLKACVALFPEIVGRMAVDVVLRQWAGEVVGDAVITPSALITRETLSSYYTSSRTGWTLKPNVAKDVVAAFDRMPVDAVRGKRLSFVIHYRTHEWYQNVAQAMQSRADEVGIELSVVDVTENFRAEIRDLRRMIGKLAASYVEDGDTIILDTGTTTSAMAQFLRGFNDLTVITSSIDVFQRLREVPGITLMMTGGVFDPETASFIGRGPHLLLGEIRADKLFLVAGGVSVSFGISCINMQEAEVRRSMIRSSREIILLADHTVLDTESNVHVGGLDVVDTIITDPGVSSSQRLAFSQQGIKLIVAGRMVP